MALLKRLCDNFWSYVSPTKPAPANTAPQTIPRVKRRAAPLRSSSLQDVVKSNRSMSPIERVDSWRLGSASTGRSSVTTSRKRKRASTPSKRSAAGARRRRIVKMEDEDMDYTPANPCDSDIEMNDREQEEEEDAQGDQYADEEEEEDEDEDNDDNDTASATSSNIRVASRSASRSPRDFMDDNDTSEIDTSLVVSESAYEEQAPKRRMPTSPSTEHFQRGVSSEEMRAQGWDDDHITLVQKIAMRGHEPLMPNYWKFEYRFHMPDSLFIATDGDDTDAIIGSVRQKHRRAIIAIEKLFELGGRMRDRVMLQGQVTPEQQVRRTLKEYIRWANTDSGLDHKSAIPLLALETKSANIDANDIKQNAKRKCEKLARRYRNAFRVLQSIENSPGSRTSTQLAYPVPTIYALIASHTLIALTAYNPEDAEPDIKIVAMFEMKDKDYDVWNALALAIVVCHLRNVQVRIAEETGLGIMSGAREDEVVDDPDA